MFSRQKKIAQMQNFLKMRNQKKNLRSEKKIVFHLSKERNCPETFLEKILEMNRMGAVDHEVGRVPVVGRVHGLDGLLQIEKFRS